MTEPPFATDEQGEHQQVSGEERVGMKKTEVPLIAPILLLILGSIFAGAPFFQPPDLKRDWSATFTFVVLGVTLLLISIKFFAEWSKQRKENAG